MAGRRHTLQGNPVGKRFPPPPALPVSAYRPIWTGRERLVDNGEAAVHTQPTIYDVARAAGLSIASVSRVLNDRRSTLPATRVRVMQAVAELGFIPDGPARALPGRLKEIGSDVMRPPT